LSSNPTSAFDEHFVATTDFQLSFKPSPMIGKATPRPQ